MTAWTMTPAAEPAGRGAQGLEGREQLALLQDEQREEQRDDQAGDGERRVDDRVQRRALLLDAGDRQARSARP